MNPESSESLEIYAPIAGKTYTLEEAERVSGAPKRNILVYCNSGLIPDVEKSEVQGLLFGDVAIRTIRHVEFLKHVKGINLEGIRVILELQNEVETLRADLQFYREL